MRFDNIFAIYLLWLVPFIAVFLYFSMKHKQKLLAMFCENELYEKIIEGYSLKRKKIKVVLIVLSCLFLILALTKPQLGFNWEQSTSKGVDIYIAVDVSDSMLAQDINPSRLERAKRKLIDFMNILRGDRVGLILFAGSSAIQCPLTLDYSAMQMFIDDINPDSISNKGTSISSAIKTALDGFRRSSESHSKAIILITDGEDHGGKLEELAKQAQSDNVKIYAIGIGSLEGSKIPLSGGFKKDLLGKEIISKPNFDELKIITSITGGTFVNSVSGDMDIDSIYLNGIKKALASKDIKSSREKKWIDRFQWPLALALFLILCEFFIPERKRREK